MRCQNWYLDQGTVITGIDGFHVSERPWFRDRSSASSLLGSGRVAPASRKRELNSTILDYVTSGWSNIQTINDKLRKFILWVDFIQCLYEELNPAVLTSSITSLYILGLSQTWLTSCVTMKATKLMGVTSILIIQVIHWLCPRPFRR